MTRPPAKPRPRRRPELWVCAAAALAAVQAALRLIPEARPGMAGVYCWGAGIDLVPPAAAAVGLAGLITAATHRPFWTAARAAGFLALAGLAASPLAFTAYPSSHDGKPSAVAFRVPLDGPVRVVSGGAAPAGNRHAPSAERRWAFDLTVVRDGRTHRGGGKDPADYFVYGLPVLAPADGKVVETRDDEADSLTRGALTPYTTPGNFVVLEVAPGEYLWLCHLKAGSITVTTGDEVAQGHAIARVGGSGDAREPHLHVHLQDSDDPDFSEAVPMEFHHYRAGGRFVARGVPHGGAAGQTVENVEVSTPPPSRPQSPPPRGNPPP